jgi:penicillin-binding protein 1C
MSLKGLKGLVPRAWCLVRGLVPRAWGVLVLRAWGVLVPRAWGVAGALIAAGALVAATWIRLGPLPDGFLELSSADSTSVVDRNGVPLYEARGGGGLRGETLTADKLPKVLVDATLAAEDHRFFHHPGIDPIALARAARHNLAEGRIVEGGSTLSQQVVKLLRARAVERAGRSPERRGFRAKLQEMLLAQRLEHRLSKEEILALYLNVAPYGNQIAGAERASRAYFGVTASMLTPAQAAFLAALPQQPSRFNPWQHPDRAAKRARRVLERMRALALLDESRTAEALAERLTLRRDTAAFAAPHFVERVLDGAWYDSVAQPFRAAGRIVTTLDAALQAEVTGIIRSHRRDLERHGAHNVAVVVLDNVRGEWLAWEGSGDYFDAAHGGAIDGAIAPRQPGSALKPFTYALAFDAGYGPSSVLPDVPSHFPTAEPGVVYRPRNYDGRFRGPMRARLALAGSENVPAVALLSELGPPALVRFLRRAGLSTFDKTVAHYGLGVTLGNAEVRLDELVAAYASFARGGQFVAPVGVRGANVRKETRLASERAAFWITDVLSDADAREFVFGRGGSLEFPFPVAAKTGTSQGYRDNWAIGYTREVTVGVWVGNFDRAPLRNSSGVTGAGPIFHAVMLAAVGRYGSVGPGAWGVGLGGRGPAFAAEGGRFGEASRGPVDRSFGIAKDTICALSGMHANAWCPSRVSEWAAVEAERLPCSWHHQTDEGTLVVWPTRYRSWAADRGLLAIGPRASDLVPRAVLGPRSSEGPRASEVVRASRRSETSALQIVSPPDGATYLIDPTLRSEFQTLPLRASAPGGGSIEWRINGKPAGEVAADGTLMWPLRPGRHVVSARDERGRTAEATIVVR